MCMGVHQWFLCPLPYILGNGREYRKISTEGVLSDIGGCPQTKGKFTGPKAWISLCLRVGLTFREPFQGLLDR